MVLLAGQLSSKLKCPTIIIKMMASSLLRTLNSTSHSHLMTLIIFTMGGSTSTMKCSMIQLVLKGRSLLLPLGLKKLLSLSTTTLVECTLMDASPKQQAVFSMWEVAPSSSLVSCSQIYMEVLELPDSKLYRLAPTLYNSNQLGHQSMLETIQ